MLFVYKKQILPQNNTQKCLFIQSKAQSLCWNIWNNWLISSWFVKLVVVECVFLQSEKRSIIRSVRKQKCSIVCIGAWITASWMNHYHYRMETTRFFQLCYKINIKNKNHTTWRCRRWIKFPLTFSTAIKPGVSLHCLSELLFQCTPSFHCFSKIMFIVFSILNLLQTFSGVREEQTI